MRGGKREGAGRKPVEATVRVSVPLGALEQVNEVIKAYKAGLLKPGQEIKEAPLNDSREIKTSPLKGSPEIKEARKALECLSSPTRRVLIKSFGSLYKAALLGVRAESDGGIRYPRELRPSLDLGSVSVHEKN